MWSSSGSNTHLLEIRYDLVQHLEYGGQIRADGKHPKIKNTPTITPDRSPSRILRMLQHVLPFPTSNRVGEFSPPSPSPEKLAAEKQARVPSDQFTKRKKSFFRSEKKKSIHLFFHLYFPIRILNAFSPFANISSYRCFRFRKKIFIQLSNLHFNRPATQWLNRVNHERDSRTISCLSSLFEWMAGGITTGKWVIE